MSPGEWVALILTVTTLLGLSIRGVVWALRYVLVSEGLIRPGKDKPHWPEPWDSLPDAIEGMAEIIRTHQH